MKSTLVLAALAAVTISTGALAGQCPAASRGVGVRAADTTPAKGVVDTVLTSIDVAREPAAITGRSFRLRRLEIAPGGVVPWHSHRERPAIIYIVSGTVTEYASTCRVPIVHRAGEATPELNRTSHWWRNTGRTKAVLLSSDLLKVGEDGEMM